MQTKSVMVLSAYLKYKRSVTVALCVLDFNSQYIIKYAKSSKIALV